MSTRMAVVLGAIGLLIGALGPWVTALGIVSIGPTSNTEITIVMFGGFAALIASVLVGRWMRVVTITVGVLAAIEVIHAIAKLQKLKQDAGEWGALVSPGWGLYVSALAAIFLVISTWVSRRPVQPAPAPQVS